MMDIHAEIVQNVINARIPGGVVNFTGAVTLQQQIKGYVRVAYADGPAGEGFSYDPEDKIYVSFLTTTKPLAQVLPADFTSRTQFVGEGGGILNFDSYGDFPATGTAGIIYIDDNENTPYRWDTVGEDYASLSTPITLANVSAASDDAVKSTYTITSGVVPTFYGNMQATSGVGLAITNTGGSGNQSGARLGFTDGNSFSAKIGLSHAEQGTFAFDGHPGTRFRWFLTNNEMTLNEIGLGLGITPTANKFEVYLGSMVDNQVHAMRMTGGHVSANAKVGYEFYHTYGYLSRIVTEIGPGGQYPTMYFDLALSQGAAPTNIMTLSAVGLGIGTRKVFGAANMYIEMTGAAGFNFVNPNNDRGHIFTGDFLRLTPGGGGRVNLQLSTDASISRYAAGKLAVGNGSFFDYSGILIAGVIGIGTATPAYMLDVGDFNVADAHIRINSSSDNQSLFFAHAGQNRFAIHQGGAVLNFVSQNPGTGQSFYFTGGSIDATRGALMKVTGTFNQPGVNLEGLLVNITNTDSAATSSIVNFMVDAVSKFHLGVDGKATFETVNAVGYEVGGIPGVTGSFTTVDGKTITANNGIITSIV